MRSGSATTRSQQIHPGLIYASISGYGQTGPDRARGGFDLIAQGVAGIMSVTGEPDGPPVKAGVPVTDLAAGLFALVGILAALQHRHRTGAGQRVDTSLVDAGVALSVWEATEYFSGIGMPSALGSAHRMNAPYQAIRCADGYITLGAANERLFRRLCDVLEHPEWPLMAEFADNASRVANRVNLAGRIEAITTRQDRTHWLALLEANDIPCGPINDYAQVFADRQVVAREMVVQVEHPTLGHLRTLGSAIKMSATPPEVIAAGAVAGRAYRRGARRGRLRRRGDRHPSPCRRGSLKKGTGVFFRPPEKVRETGETCPHFLGLIANGFRDVCALARL